jgi:hypothetical protein
MVESRVSGADVAPTAMVEPSVARADDDPTAKVESPVSGADVAPTAKVEPSVARADADPTAMVESRVSGADVAPTAKVEPSATRADADPTAKVEPSVTRPDTSPTAKVLPPMPLGDTRVEPIAEKPQDRARQPVVLPIPVNPSAPSGGASVAFGTRPDNRRRSLLVGALVAVLLLGLLVAVPLLSSGDDDPKGGGRQAGATSSAAPTEPSAGPASDAPSPGVTSASPTPSATPSADPDALPEGWVWHKDPAGFSLPLPKGWVRRSVGRNTVVFDERDGVGELLVQWTSTPGDDAYADWKRQEPYRKNYVKNYQYLGINPCDYYKTCADWEWLETRDNTRIHVRNRGFVTARNRGYALRWEVAASDWDKRLPDFDRIARGFKPDRVD